MLASDNRPVATARGSVTKNDSVSDKPTNDKLNSYSDFVTRSLVTLSLNSATDFVLPAGRDGARVCLAFAFGRAWQQGDAKDCGGETPIGSVWRAAAFRPRVS